MRIIRLLFSSACAKYLLPDQEEEDFFFFNRDGPSVFRKSSNRLSSSWLKNGSASWFSGDISNNVSSFSIYTGLLSFGSAMFKKLCGDLVIYEEQLQMDTVSA